MYCARCQLGVRYGGVRKMSCSHRAIRNLCAGDGAVGQVLVLYGGIRQRSGTDTVFGEMLRGHPSTSEGQRVAVLHESGAGAHDVVAIEKVFWDVEYIAPCHGFSKGSPLSANRERHRADGNVALEGLVVHDDGQMGRD